MYPLVSETSGAKVLRMELKIFLDFFKADEEEEAKEELEEETDEVCDSKAGTR